MTPGRGFAAGGSPPEGWPPEAEEALREARRLEELGPGERRASPEGTGGDGGPGPTGAPRDDPWRSLLLELYAAEGGPLPRPSALAMMEALRPAVPGRGHRRRLLARFCQLPSVQRRWAAWTDVTDREELRLRLELIGRFERLEPSLADFLLFYFRASDPGVYQPAAIAVGRHAGRQPELEEAVVGYASRRGLAPDGAVPLVGRRGHRRVLLARVAAACLPEEEAGGGDSGAAGRFVNPLAVEAPRPDPDEDADWAAYLLALILCVESDDPGQLADDALRRMARAGPRPPSRITARRWGRLFASLVRLDGEGGSDGGEGPDGGRVGLWARLADAQLDAFAAAGPGEFARRFRCLEAADELLRTLSFLPAPSRAAAWTEVEEQLAGETLLFAGLRAAAWLRREGEDVPGRLLGGAPPGDDGAERLLRRVGETLRAQGGDEAGRLTGDPGDRAAAGLLAHLLECLSERDRWTSMPEEDRALVAFHLVDETRWNRLPPGRVSALLARHGGFPGLDGDPGRRARPPGTAGPATVAVLRRIVAWEGPGSERMVDARLLHQAGDVALYLSLLPTGSTSEENAALADAFEHQLRSRLRLDPDFDPARFLYRLSVREPHPSFFAALARATADRAYEDSSGRSVDVHGLVERLRSELASAAEAETADADLGSRPASPPAPAGGEAPFLESVSRLGTRLGRLRGETSTVRALEALAELLSRGGRTSETRPEDLGSLLRAVSLPGEPLPRSGSPPWDERTFPQAATELSRAAGALAGELPDLTPDSLERTEETRDAVRVLDAELAGLAEWLPPVLPRVEARAFEAAVDDLRRRLARWGEAVGRLHRIWDRGEDSTWREEDWEELFRTAASIDDRRFRADCLELVWSSLTDMARRADDDVPGEARVGGDDDPWLREERLLRWGVAVDRGALDSEALEAWTSGLTRSWVRLAEHAVREGAETRAARLVRAPEFRALRGREEAEAALSELRQYFFDCYRIPDAIRARTAGGGSGQLPVAGELTAFALHYSPVWLALLIGAVLMLDFGDPWTAMAQVGDVQGIAVTFAVGVLGAFGYVFADLRRRVADAPEDSAWRNRAHRLGRAGAFLVACLAYTLVLTGALWSLLSGTDQVVRGPGASLHVLVWTGFALFVGIFFGLVTKSA